MLFFLTLNEDLSVSFSPFQERDKLDPQVISYLSAPFPLAVIKGVLERLNRRDPFSFWGKEKTLKKLKSLVLYFLGDYHSDISNLEWKEVNGCSAYADDQYNLDQGLENKAWKAFNQIVLGRQLSEGDLRRLARELALKDDEITMFAHDNVRQGKAQWVPSVQMYERGWQCQRCGEKEIEEWPSFYGMAASCQSCMSIGASTSLNVLYRDNRSLLEGPSKVLFQPHWILTEAQRLASEQVADFIINKSEDRALLWAACGAGKTEVCFPSAAWALKQGKSVLFAAPRQDVIHDIAPRLQRDFPDYPVQVLTGTSSVKFQEGGMVLATNHQILRFWQAFDVIFMDEMDAFPYHGSRALEWGLNHALRPGGKLLYLTATPSLEGLKAVQKGDMLLIRLPARHHRNPLPVPIWSKFANSLEPNRCTDIWVKQIESLKRKGPLLVFVPKISLIDPWIKCFKRGFPGWRIEGSYSADSKRGLKIKNLQQGKYDLFVSTTILERGITLQGVQVVVLGADHPIFDERALVQMAGRVGRTRENPGGEVVFLSKEVTAAMKTAVQWIEEQNRRALELGLIDPVDESREKP